MHFGLHHLMCSSLAYRVEIKAMTKGLDLEDWTFSCNLIISTLMDKIGYDLKINL
jgi:hypothetical protein